MKGLIGKIVQEWRRIKIVYDWSTAKYRAEMMEMFPEKNPNYDVSEENYLSPKIRKITLPLNYPGSLHAHYKTISEELGHLLENGFMSSTRMTDFNLPKYLLQYVRDFKTKGAILPHRVLNYTRQSMEW